MSVAIGRRLMVRVLFTFFIIGICEACNLGHGEIIDPPAPAPMLDSARAMSSAEAAAPPPALPLAQDYRSWALVLKDVQRSDAGQVRDIYVNGVGAAAVAGQPFPNGSVMVMDLFAAQKDGAANVVLDANGKLIKGELLKTYVMGKGAGWGDGVDPALQNGDWTYAAYAADLSALPDSMGPCFACHLPLGAAKDWVHRYDELMNGLHPVSSGG